MILKIGNRISDKIMRKRKKAWVVTLALAP